ncbi:LysR family transcriptional regulator [Sorangium sp. So ce134]
MDEPLETSELRALSKTVAARSMPRAAAEPGAPRAAVGRRLARLEERLGVRLLRRTTRRLALVDGGSHEWARSAAGRDAAPVPPRSRIAPGWYDAVRGGARRRPGTAAFEE